MGRICGDLFLTSCLRAFAFPHKSALYPALDGHRTVQDWERVGSACGLIFVDACTWTV